MTDPNSIYVKNSQAGCIVKLYHNQGYYGNYKNNTTVIFSEIKKCSSASTITDVGGQFTIYLAPTQPWDDIIKGDDYLRIFYGDEIASSDVSDGATNLTLDFFGSTIKIPVIGSGWNFVDGMVAYDKTISAPKTLNMYERFVGRVDRCQRISRASTKNSGPSVYYVVTGRSLGGILQDIMLAYNPYIPGLNAVSVWFTKVADTNQKSPSELVKLYLSSLLVNSPMPQFKLPYSLLLDYLGESGIADRAAELQVQVQKTISDISKAVVPKEGTQSAFERLNELVANGPNLASTSPLMIINLDNMGKTYGSNYNTSWLSNMSTSSYDFIKYLSNPQFNEFYFDILPTGDVNGGTADSDVRYPGFVCRQRPYDITDKMINGVCDPISYDTEGGRYFDQANVPSKLSLLDLLEEGGGILVFGPMQKPDDMNNFWLHPIMPYVYQNIASKDYVPRLLDYQVGFTNMARFNSYLCLAIQPTSGGSPDGGRQLMTSCEGFKIDTESVSLYGYRALEVSTPYASFKDDMSSMKNFTNMLANWYCLNQHLQDGVMTCHFLKEARIGVPCVYVETRLSPSNPYPKLEISYIQGLQDDYEFGKGLTTTLTVTRGLKYDLRKMSSPLTAFTKG